MTLLALEFSSPRRSAALARGGSVLAEAVETTTERGTNVFGLIEKLLAETGLARQEIEAIAVGLGPGSYTGIRAAIAVAQGWQLARAVRVLGVSSVESMAAQAEQEKKYGRVHMVVDAQRGEFYLSTWELGADGRREVTPLRIVTAAEIAGLGGNGDLCLGPEQTPAYYPAAAMIARLASGRTDFVAAEGLEPIYLRETSFVKSPAGRVA
jgi:tRNA threonylcarbamoyladenosine biosynthesis protein TsaB